jgi:hypothetical protein
LDYLKGATSGNTNIFGNFNIDPKEYAGLNALGTGVYYDTATGNYYDNSGGVVPIFSGEGE